MLPISVQTAAKICHGVHARGQFSNHARVDGTCAKAICSGDAFTVPGSCGVSCTLRCTRKSWALDACSLHQQLGIQRLGSCEVFQSMLVFTAVQPPTNWCNIALTLQSCYILATWLLM